ncbi:MAG: ribonuclease H-like domain-containing protein [bacterium]
MIRNSFIFLDGIGEKTERLLWQKGILSWDDFLSAEIVPLGIRSRRTLYEESLIYFAHELLQDNAKPFARFMQRRDHWRLFDHFGNRACCLDIETNGMPPHDGGEITMVGFYDGRTLRQYIRGINLSEESIAEELVSCKLLITFFGSVFDIPFLKRKYRSLDFAIPHFDLCFAAKRAGITGGLKKVEPQLGILRDEHIRNLNGFDAVKLWQEWNRGKSAALETLCSYNAADTVNLFGLAGIIYEKLLELSGFRKYHEKFSSSGRQ